MASYTINADKVSTPLLTLTGGAEDTITFTDRFANPTVVVHSASAAVWVTGDGNTANPASGYGRALLSGQAGRLNPTEVATPTVVRVYSTAGATYSVER